MARCDRCAFGRSADLERQLDVALHGPPVEQDRRLEDHPVIAVAPSPLGGFAVHGDRARRGRGQVADEAEQRRLAAARRPDERDELARGDGQVDVDECLHAAGALGAPLEDLRDAGDLDDRSRLRCTFKRHVAAASGRRSCRSTQFSTPATSRYTPIPRSDETTIVAHRYSALSE